MKQVPDPLLVVYFESELVSCLPIGSLCGLAGGLTANFLVAATYEDGLSQFLRNTSENYAVLAGSCTAFGLSLVLTIVLSLATHKIKSAWDEKVSRFQVKRLKSRW